MTNQNEAQIIRRIEDLKGDLALNFKQICELLVLVSNHYLHRDPLFRWYREVATAKLIPEVVMAMAMKRGYLKHLMGRPREVQFEVARDREFDWCTAVNGEILDRRSSWKKMGAADFKRMFPIGQPIRSLHEQREALRAEMDAEPVTHIRRQPLARVDTQAQTFSLGAQTVPLSVVLASLREVGIQSTDL